jgi:hypothetical protein
MEARNKTSEEYVHIARFYPLESNREAVLKVEYLTGVGTFLEFNRKTIERGKIYTPKYTTTHFTGLVQQL